jgi:hypothetical protein
VKRSLLIVILLSGLAAPGAMAKPQNVYEWSAVAPIVVTGLSQGQDGRYVDLVVERVFRGDLEPGSVARVDIRTTNRDRNRTMDPHALHLYEGERYLLLMKQGPRSSSGTATYVLVRGVHGARELPAEGADLLYGALQQFVEIQDLKNDRHIWAGLTELLEVTNPIVLQTALEQFQKFRRGEPQLLITLRPLLDHPQAEIREDTARLIGQIVQRHAGDEIPEEGDLRGELIGAARRDPAPAVRVWATWALGRFPDAAAEEVLEEISDSDPEQEVRYAAEKILLERRKTAR